MSTTQFVVLSHKRLRVAQAEFEARTRGGQPIPSALRAMVERGQYQDPSRGLVTFTEPSKVAAAKLMIELSEGRGTKNPAWVEALAAAEEYSDLKHYSPSSELKVEVVSEQRSATARRAAIAAWEGGDTPDEDAVGRGWLTPVEKFDGRQVLLYVDLGGIAAARLLVELQQRENELPPKFVLAIAEAQVPGIGL